MSDESVPVVETPTPEPKVVVKVATKKAVKKVAAPVKKAGLKVAAPAGRPVGSKAPKSPTPGKLTKVMQTDTKKMHGRVALLIKNVSDPTRLAICDFIDSSDDKELHVGAICLKLGCSQPAVSHHLALMRHSRVVEARRDGKHNYYGLTDIGNTLMKTVRALQEADQSA